MAYCAICGRYHDPGVGCLDGTRNLLHDTGTIPPPQLSREEFKDVSRQADRWFSRVLLWALLVIVVLLLIASFASRSF